MCLRFCFPALAQIHSQLERGLHKQFRLPIVSPLRPVLGHLRSLQLHPQRGGKCSDFHLGFIQTLSVQSSCVVQSKHSSLPTFKIPVCVAASFGWFLIFLCPWDQLVTSTGHPETAGRDPNGPTTLCKWIVAMTPWYRPSYSLQGCR